MSNNQPQALPRFDPDEFMELARALESSHAVFDKLWSLGRPQFTTQTKTAALYFDRVGECVDFRINPDFWSGLTFKQKQFVIAHECLHVILYHGFRINELKPNELPLANKALDVVVNHSLVDKFGFNRSEVDPEGKYCWVDTVFPKSKVPPSGRFYEFYYSLLKEQFPPNKNDGKKEKGEKGNAGNPEPSDGSGKPGEGQPGAAGEPQPGGEVLDDHDGLESFNNPDFENQAKEMLSDLDAKGEMREFVEKQISDIKGKCQQAGVEPGSAWYIVKKTAVRPKPKWETVIKRWALKYMKEKEDEQWARRNRRFAFLDTDFMIPSEQEVEEYEKDRIEVWFFQDTSGSCQHFIDRFFSAAESLPKEKFAVKMHCFDTRVFETTLESRKLYGFGGTSFSCIERYIQNYCKTHNVPYPKAVFVITDGYGDHVHPEKPKNWYWFLDGADYLIPKDSHRFNLKDFE